MQKMKSKKTIWVTIIEYACLIMAIGFILYLVMALKEAELSKYPLSYGYGGDGITGLTTVKSMLENGWIYENPYIGAPFGGANYDATTMELLLSLIEQVLVWITGNWVLSYNVFYLMGYFLIGITALYALKQLKVHSVIAVPLAVLYAFAPYHQLRGTGHIYLGMYFMVPLMVLYLYRLMKQEQLFEKGKMIFSKSRQGYLTWKNLLRVLCLMCMALSGIYYAFFTCFFLCVVILYRILNYNYSHADGKRKLHENVKGLWKQIAQSLLSIVIIVGTLVAGAIPNLIYWMQNGRTEAVMAKGGEGAEIYGLKMIQLLLPIPNHRIGLFAKVRNFYDSYYPLINENGTSSLGVIMAIGFVILCVALFISWKLPKESNLRIGSIFTLAAVLFGTVGGYAVLMSFVTGAIRCYNRFSIFIAMFALIAIAELIQLLYDKWKNIIVLIISMVILLAFGIYDQTTPLDIERYHASAAAFEKDEELVQAIDAIEDENAMIYQMPYMRYPENGGIQNMPDYAHMMGYLHSDNLRWSYGAVAGREGDQWFKEIAEYPLEEQIEAVKQAGFAGIYVDWNAYLPDERTRMEQIFEACIGDVSASDSDNTRVYYSFR